MLLVAHGSPDPAWRVPLDAVCERARLLAPERRVELCFLEHNDPDLESAIGTMHSQGIACIRVIALLLSGGGRHMRVDIPAIIQRAHTRLPGLEIELVAHPAGVHEVVIDALARVALADSAE